MTSLPICIAYNGSWVKSDDQFQYIGGKCKGIVLPHSSTFSDLVEKIYGIVGIDRKYYYLRLNIASPLKHLPPIDIADNDDLQFYRLQVERKVPGVLCVSVELKVADLNTLNQNQTPIDPIPVVEFAPDCVGKACHSSHGGNPKKVKTCNTEIHNVAHAHGEFMHDSNEHGVSGGSSNSFNDLPKVDQRNKRKKGEVDEICGFSGISNSSQELKNRSSTHLDYQIVERDEYDVSFHFPTIESIENDKDILQKDQMFSSKEELKYWLSVYAMKKNFEFRVTKSDKERLSITCIGENCSWSLRATKLGMDTFMIRKYCGIHTCSPRFGDHDHKQASSSVIARLIKTKYERTWRTYKAQDIIHHIREEYGISISYHKALQAREYADTMIEELLKASFGILPKYCFVLEQIIPGTVTHIKVDDSSNFQYFFMALGPSIRGFHNHIRPVIMIDAIDLKGKYCGVLFVSACLDGNNQIYPLAFGIGDSENAHAWEWFLTKLHELIGEIPNLVIISDWNATLATDIASIFPNASHGACIYRLTQNLHKWFKNEKVKSLFLEAVEAYRLTDFQRLWEEIQHVSRGMANYLKDVGFHRWARAHFTEHRRNIMTINFVEILNQNLADVKNFPITVLVEHLRGLLQQWFYERRTAAMDLNTSLTPWAEQILEQKRVKSLTMRVVSFDHHHFVIRDGDDDARVDLHMKTCTCHEFILDGIPCAHAIIAARERHVDSYTLCSNYFSSEALVAVYADLIYPPCHQGSWKIPKQVDEVVVLPPIARDCAMTSNE